MALTKTEIYQQIDGIINYIDPERNSSDAEWISRVARGINRLERLRDKIKRDVHG